MRSIKDYDYRVQTPETLIQIATVQLMLGRLVTP